jgi:hypothetical protein
LQRVQEYKDMIRRAREERLAREAQEREERLVQGG